LTSRRTCVSATIKTYPAWVPVDQPPHFGAHRQATLRSYYVNHLAGQSVPGALAKAADWFDRASTTL
jgi:hypothetical protein